MCVKIKIIKIWYCLRKARAFQNIIEIKKPLNTPVFIYADTESLLEKIHACDKKPKESVTSKLRRI